MKNKIILESLSLNISTQALPKAYLNQFQQQLTDARFNQAREQLFSGGKINQSEACPALHTALRDRTDASIVVDGEDIKPKIKASLDQMSLLVDQITSGDLKPAGEVITDIVHIGIGGSALGPELCYQALRHYRINNIRIHFISVIDSDVLQDLLDTLNPKTTLFFLASKSFSTEEMHCQAKVAQAWLEQAGCNSTNHFLASTANVKEAEAFGIKPENSLPFWHWVGGRFSLWSSVSFCVALAIGMENFYDFLAGAYSMDQHFRQAPIDENIPLMLACLSAWHADENKKKMHGIIPYTNKLSMLPAYLQQLQMESLGKSVTQDNQPNKKLASPVIFGDVGTRSQHALSQYFMQAPIKVPLDIIYIDDDKHNNANDQLKAHAKAQSQVLWQGFEDKDRPYKNIAAHHPHSLITLKELTPFALGQLLAAYEHKTFALGVLYKINPFDQWGVERGKIIAKQLLSDQIEEKNV